MNISRFWKASAGFSFFTLISRVFGYVRDLLFSSLLGASTIHDIFVVVFKIPNVFRSFFGEGALSQSLTPSIIEANVRVEKLLNQVFSLLFITLLTFVSFVMIFPNIFINLFAPGFISDAEKYQSAASFLQLVFPYIMLISFVAFFGAYQNSKKKFQIVAATPIIFNLTLIIFALSSSELSLGVIGIAILTAGMLQLIINGIASAYLNYIPSLDFNFDRTLMSSFFSRLIPAIFAAGIYQLNVLVDTVFASYLVTGSPTWLYLSDRLIQFPMGLFGVAIALVALPDLTEAFKDGKKDSFRKILAKGSISTFLIGFVSFIFYFFAATEIIKLLFFRGEFTSYDVDMTVSSLIAYSFALPFLLSSKFFNSVFFAISKTKVVLALGVISLITNVVLNYLFIFEYNWGHTGLALATTYAAILVWLIALILILRVRRS